MEENIGIIAVVMFAVVVAVCMVGLLIWSLVWVYSDAESRGKPGWAVSLIVLFLNWPTSLMLWIVFRPQRLVNKSKPAQTSSGWPGSTGQ